MVNIFFLSFWTFEPNFLDNFFLIKERQTRVNENEGNERGLSEF